MIRFGRHERETVAHRHSGASGRAIMKQREPDTLTLDPGIGSRDRPAIRNLIRKLRVARAFLKSRGIAGPKPINKAPA